jgi:hypothetical protein
MREEPLRTLDASFFAIRQCQEYFAKHREGGHTVIPDSLHSLKIVRDVTYKSFWRFVMFRDSSMTESPKTVTEPSRNRHGTVTEPSRNVTAVTELSRNITERHGRHRTVTEYHGTVTEYIAAFQHEVTEPSRNHHGRHGTVTENHGMSRNRHGTVTEPSRNLFSVIIPSRNVKIRDQSPKLLL